MSTAISLRNFVDNYERGVYDMPDQNAVNSIWHDRQVTELDIQRRTRPLAKKVMRFLKVAQTEVDMDKNYIYFRNTKTDDGEAYDTFSITEKDSKKVLFFICPKIVHSAVKGKAQLLSVSDDRHYEIFGQTYGKALDELRSKIEKEEKEMVKTAPDSSPEVQSQALIGPPEEQKAQVRRLRKETTVENSTKH